MRHYPVVGIRVPHPLASSHSHGDIERPNKGPTDRRNIVKRGIPSNMMRCQSEIYKFSVSYSYYIIFPYKSRNSILICYMDFAASDQLLVMAWKGLKIFGK
jgi:hypothetical protein